MRISDNLQTVGRHIRLPFFALALILIAASFPITGVYAQDNVGLERVIDVGIYVDPPFVIDDSGQYSGMAIELWESLAAKQNLRSNCHRYETIKELVDATASGKVGVAVTRASGD